jgi:DNA-binding NarL/FixJ family response regulator
MVDENNIIRQEIEVDEEELRTADDLFYTPREKQVWILLATKSIEEIAEELGLAVDTVETYRDRVYSKRKRAVKTVLYPDWVREQQREEKRQAERNGGDEHRDSE